MRAWRWLVKEEGVEDALRLLEGADELHAPKLLLGEAANAVWKRVRRGEVSADTGAEAILLPGYIHVIFDAEAFLTEAFRMACAFDHPVYGCLYLAGAQHFDLPFVTADARLIRKFAGTLYSRHIVPLSEWHP